MADLDVLLVGPYPPPYGGISAHVQRLARSIQAAGLSAGVLNHFQGQAADRMVIGELHRNAWRYWWAVRQARARARVVHYHHSRWSTLLATALAVRRGGNGTVATIHGRELDPFLRTRVPGVAPVTRAALRSFDVLVAVSVEIESSLRDVGRPVKVIPAYLPAHDEQVRASPRAAAFLRRGINLVVAAYRLTTDDRGRTIYGLETALGAFASAAPVRPELQLAVFLANEPSSHHERELLHNLIAAVHDEHIRSRIAVFCGEPLTPAFALTAVYLRPTLTDGDAVSIREAIAAGVPVVASDVVRRPREVVTVGADVSEWCGAILEALERPPSNLPAAGVADPTSELMDIYAALGCAAGATGG
ncbi:MAG TPA: glycosyltransferase [Solirubrobacteraceae bacterium]|nr:glycosyltransferase [Solirubrobacteraceae bacterium]